MSSSEIGYLLVLPRFEYSAAKTVEDACSLLSQHGNKGKILAGGTDVLVEMKKRHMSPQFLIGIKAIPELDYIRYDEEDGLRIGALATIGSVANSALVKEKYGLLSTACKKIGTPQVRNVATLAGNVCMAGPSQDTPPSLIVLAAELKLVSADGERTVGIDGFYTGPFQNGLGDRELLTEIRIPTLPARSTGSYCFVKKATEVCETLAGVAVFMTLDPAAELCEEIKIGLCSVVPKPLRAMRAEEVLRGKRLDDNAIERAAQIAAGDAMPRSRAEYRRHITYLLTKKAIYEVWQAIRETLV